MKKFDTIFIENNHYNGSISSSYVNTVMTIGNIDIAISIKSDNTKMIPIDYAIIENNSILITKSTGINMTGIINWDNEEHTLAHCNLE